MPTWGDQEYDWEDVGAFVLHCTNEVLDDIIKNHHEVFNSRPVPEAQGSSSSNRNRFSFKLPERSFQIEGKGSLVSYSSCSSRNRKEVLQHRYNV